MELLVYLVVGGMLLAMGYFVYKGYKSKKGSQGPLPKQPPGNEQER